MKKRTIFLLIPFLTGLCQACQNGETNIDRIIDEYDRVNFEGLRNKSVYYRSGEPQKKKSIYFVNDYEGTCSPYAVEFDEEKKRIISIKNSLVISSCGKDYFTQDDIKSVMGEYIKYKLCLVQVDEEGSVYINPDKSELPTLLRKSPVAASPDLKVFRHYKGNWYVRI